MSKKHIQFIDEWQEKPNFHLLHLSVLRQLNNRRRGTAKAKTRAEVRGGGRKPWRQKGTGRARVGSIRSPLWVGGGISFGPKVRDYKFDIPKKARQRAIAEAIVLKKDSLIVLKTLPEITDFKTKKFKTKLDSLGATKPPILLVLDQGEPNYEQVKKASRNLPGVNLKDHKLVGAYDVLRANTIIVTEKALDALNDRFSNLVKKEKGKVA